MAWQAQVAQPIGIVAGGAYSIVIQYYDDADPANAGVGLGPSGTGTAAASTDLITITGHGLVAGDQIVISALTGGAGLAVGVPYKVIAAGLTANTFAVTQSVAGTAVDITSNATSLTASKVKMAVNVLWSEAFNMPLVATTQDLINEAIKRGQVARAWLVQRDSARGSVLTGSIVAVT